MNISTTALRMLAVNRILTHRCRGWKPTELMGCWNFLQYNRAAFANDSSQLDIENNVDEEITKPLRAIKSKSGMNPVRYFVDWKSVKVCGGDGGDGNISFLSVYGVEFAGPDGGDGGCGGHVIFKASGKFKDLSHLKIKISAPRGIAGRSTNRHGRDSEHLVVSVPVGTVLRNVEGVIVADLAREGVSFIAAKGGAGGKGNSHFKTSVRQAPEIAESGGVGEQFNYMIELRTMADIGLIGFPNAGKSTLLTAISRARPKIAAYPFTTLNPHIGMVQYSDLTQLAVADLPGLLPGAHKNHGLGIAFLRHIERCSVLLFVLDMGLEEPWEQLDQLKFELEQYEPGLSGRPGAIVANKMDLDESNEKFLELQRMVGSGTEIIPISGKMGMNLTNLLIKMKRLNDDVLIKN